MQSVSQMLIAFRMVAIASEYIYVGVQCTNLSVHSTPILVCYSHAQKWCAKHTLYSVPVWMRVVHQFWCAMHTLIDY